MGHNNIWYSRPRKSGAESHKCKAGSCGLGLIRFWNIQHIPFSPFPFSRKWWPTEQWSSWTRSSGHKEIACARTSPSSPASTLLPLSGEQHSCNEPESGGDADQVELDGETGYGQQARTSCPGAGFIQGRRKIWRRRRTVPCQTGRYAPLFFISHWTLALIDCIIISIVKRLSLGRGYKHLKGIMQACQYRFFINLFLVRLLDSFIACAPLIWCSFSQEGITACRGTGSP